jgi:hypothetical protein
VKSVDEILRERNFSPVDKLLDLYDELEKDRDELNDRLQENPDWAGVVSPIDNQKLRERVLTGITKVKQVEDGHRIKLLELDQKNPDKDSGTRQGIILQHQKKQLPDGRIVIEKVSIEEQEASATNKN